jgi:hypothetical protein
VPTPSTLVPFLFQPTTESENSLDLQYCNGHKRYDFSTDEGFYYPGCDPKYYDIKEVDPKAFRRAYVKALFAEDQRWLTLIEGITCWCREMDEHLNKLVSEGQKRARSTGLITRVMGPTGC